MRAETLRIMAGLETRLNTLLRLENSACGHDEGVRKANRQWKKLMKWMEEQVEELARKAGEQ